LNSWKKLIVNFAIVTFVSSIILGSGAMIFSLVTESHKSNYDPKIISIVEKYGLLAWSLSMFTPQVALFIANQIEVAQPRELLQHKTIPSVCQSCRHLHGVVYNSVPFICGIHPYGWQGDGCPDWEYNS